MFQASATTAHCTMKSDFKTIFITTVTARMFWAESIALSAVTAVHVILAVIVAGRGC